MNIMKDVFRSLYRKIIPNSYLLLLEKELKGCKSVLDLGCGFKSPLKDVPKTFYSVGLDIYNPYIKTSKKEIIHDKYIKADVLDTGKLFKPKSFDAVIALGVIEHLEKKDGYKLIKLMEKIAKKKIIFFTPNGILPNKNKTKQVGHDHLSGWTFNDFQKHHYKVYGVNGLKYLKCDYADPADKIQIKFKPFFFWKLVSDISAILLFNKPELSFEIFAVKRLNNNQ